MKQIICAILCLFIHNQLTPVPKKVQLRNYQRIARNIKKIINDNPQLHIGCEIYSLNNDRLIYSNNAQHLFTPASNTKLFSAVLALELLGSDYRFETRLVTDGSLNEHILDGNVYILGCGDPSLTSDDIESLIKSLHEKEIAKITGNVCIVCDEFDQDCFAPGSFLDNIGATWNSPVSSLMIDKKPVGLQPINTVAFMDNTPLNTMFFDGISFFETLLQKYNIKLIGTITSCKQPSTYSSLSSHFSKPMSTLLRSMLKNSDNLYADCFFKKIGACCNDCPGTWTKGCDALMNFLQTTLGMTTMSLTIKDGSGRSRYNLISPHQIIALLRWIYEQPYFETFKDSLAIAGVDGTLKNRMLSLTSHVKAKTGTLAGVSALSGYLETDEDLFAFSILINGYVSESFFNPPCKTEVEDAICAIIAKKP